MRFLQLADNDMVVDEYEQYNNDRADVVLVSPSGSASEPEAEPLADDCTFHVFTYSNDLPCLLYLFPHRWNCPAAPPALSSTSPLRRSITILAEPIKLSDSFHTNTDFFFHRSRCDDVKGLTTAPRPGNGGRNS